MDCPIESSHNVIVSLLQNGGNASADTDEVVRGMGGTGKSYRLEVMEKQGSNKVLEEMDQNEEMCAAAAKGDLAEFLRLVRKHGDPNVGNYDRRTPLHLAAIGGYLDVVKYLVKHHANVDAIDRYRQTPLAEAKKNGHPDVAAFLLKHGATDIHKELGPKLYAAAAIGDLATLTKLQESGVNMGAGDYEFRTALHLAASEGHLDCVKFLVSHGTSSHVKDRYGYTPSDDAKRENNNEIVHYLATHGTSVHE